MAQESQTRESLPASEGCALISAERQRQIDAEGWTPEHDAIHMEGALALAASCYATPRRYRVLEDDMPVPVMWPWEPEWWKPTPLDRVQTPETRTRELVKAGALIAAEIDRLARMNMQEALT